MNASLLIKKIKILLFCHIDAYLKENGQCSRTGEKEFALLGTHKVILFNYKEI